MNVKLILTCTAAAAVLLGCGGGGSSTTEPTPPPPSSPSPPPTPPAPEPTKAGGIWDGTATSSGVTLVFAGVITEDGEGRFLDEDGTQYIVTGLSGNDGDVTLDFTAISRFGLTFSDGSTVTTGTLTGTVDATSLSGDYTLETGESGSVSMTYNAIYERDSSFDKLSGMWEEEFGVLTFDPDGTFFEQDSSGCIFDGEAEIIDAQFNAYALSMTVSNCNDFDGEYSGLGILSDSDATATEDLFVIQMSSDELIFTTTIERL